MQLGRRHGQTPKLLKAKTDILHIKDLNPLVHKTAGLDVDYNGLMNRRECATAS